MKRIFLPLVGLALLLAPATFSSCKEDAPKVSHTTSVTVTNDFSKVVEAINQGTLKSEAAIKKLTEAIDKMQADQATKLASIISVLGDVNKTLETKLAAIESAISAQTLSLEGKLDILAEAIGKHLLKQEELTAKITKAMERPLAVRSPRSSSRSPTPSPARPRPRRRSSTSSWASSTRRASL